MIWHLATSCYPNCHPAGVTPSPLQQSGSEALGAVVILLVILFLMRSKSKG